MKILLTNDDGWQAGGIAALYDALREDGHDVCLVAPDSEKSASGHSITWKNPLRVHKIAYRGGEAYEVGGTPADCTKIGLLNIFPEADYVLSGINNGANAGVDVLYSGTVSAALEAVLLGRPAMAVSRDFSFGETNYTRAAQVAVNVLGVISKHKMPKGIMCNLNVPAHERIKGIRHAMLEFGSVTATYAPCAKGIWPGEDWYFLTASAETRGEPVNTRSENSDRSLLSNGYATISYLGWNLQVAPPFSLPEELASDDFLGGK